MGYVFDAMTRGGEGESRPASESAERSQHAPPEAPPESTPEAPPEATPSEASSPLTPSTQAGPRLHAVDPRWLGSVDERLVSLRDPGSVTAEEYRSIRTSLLARWEQRRHLVHTITSATPEEGKTLTSLNLGLSLAELRNRRTLVLEADLRLPTFQRLLRLPPGPGLTEYLHERQPLPACTTTLGENGLSIIRAGAPAHNEAVQLLSGSRMVDLLHRLRDSYDHVIIDTPPVLDLADAGILGALSEEVLLVARMHRTPRPVIEQATRALASYKAPIAGLIATDHRNPANGYYDRYHYRYTRSARRRAA